ncbi:MAG: SPFH domain-containing protein, partial [Atopobiaceae bacterium]|nr:SPFH domain-containing protein [Atopobiaceae bacterium]
MSVEKKASSANGWPMLFVVLAGFVASTYGFVRCVIDLAVSSDTGTELSFASVGGVVLCSIAWVVLLILALGLFAIQPGQARICVLFGKYVGTVREEGLRWANPFYSRSLGASSGGNSSFHLENGKLKHSSHGESHVHGSKISTRVRTLNGDVLKVNDKMGNPIEIATVVVWHVADTAKAVFDVDDYESFVSMQTETALRHVASVYAYDHMEDEDDNPNSITLRTNIEEVSDALKSELDRKLAQAGIEVDDAKLTHLAYAPEITQAMLRRPVHRTGARGQRGVCWHRTALQYAEATCCRPIPQTP